MSRVLDITALRSLVAVADCGGFHRAAQVLSVSQSAVSQHVRRLEKVLGRPVVERDGRRTRFTADGRTLLEEARRILAVHDGALRRLGAEESRTVVVGSTEHAADQILPVLTTAVREADPRLRVRFRIDRSARLSQGVDQGGVDLAVFVAEAAAEEGTPTGALPLRWYAAPGFDPPGGGAPWPLVAVQEPCAIRRRGLRVLAERGIPATVVCDAGYLAGVLDATRAGLGVALLATAGAHPEGLVERADLPPVPPVPLSTRAREGADPRVAAAAVEAVRGLLAGAA